MGPSTCGAGCYGDYAVHMVKHYTTPLPNGEISFWLYTDTYFGCTMQVYLNGGSILLGTFESPGRTWTYYQVNYEFDISDVLFYFLDIPNSNKILIDDIRIRSTCHTPTPLPTPTPVCTAPFTSVFTDDFEKTLGRWIVKEQGGTSYGLDNRIKYSGDWSFAAGPSGCHENCYGNNSVTLTKLFPIPKNYVSIGFWLYSDGLVGSYTQVLTYGTETGTTLLGTFQPGPTWTYYEVDHREKISEVRFYFVDVTDINKVHLDLVSITTEACSLLPSLFVQNYNHPVTPGDIFRFFRLK